MKIAARLLQLWGLVRKLPRRLVLILGNFAVQRPYYVLAAIIVYLPLTALPKIFRIEPPGHLMLGNLFVDFHGWEGFWFSFALFGAVWAVMLCACLNLDGERDLPDRWIYYLDRARRRVTIPMNRRYIFVLFTSLALPGIIVVTLFNRRQNRNCCRTRVRRGNRLPSNGHCRLPGRVHQGIFQGVTMGTSAALVALAPS